MICHQYIVGLTKFSMENLISPQFSTIHGIIFADQNGLNILFGNEPKLICNRVGGWIAELTG